MQASSVHRTIVAVDIERLGDPARAQINRVAIRKGMDAVLAESLAKAGMEFSDCTVQDRGDGVLILLPDAVPAHLVTLLPDKLEAALRHYNAASAERAMRLRVAMHEGEVVESARGSFGSAIDLTFRLLHSAAAREALRVSSSHLLVICSDLFLRAARRSISGFSTYRYRSISVPGKEVEVFAWLLLPGEGPGGRLFATHAGPEGSFLSPASTVDLPVTIYVANGAVHNQVESAVRDLLDAAELEVDYQEEPVRGGQLNG